MAVTKQLLKLKGVTICHSVLHCSFVLSAVACSLYHITHVCSEELTLDIHHTAYCTHT